MSSRPALSLAVMLAVGSLTISPAFAEGPSSLLQQYKCNLCHSERGTRTGPAYVDISARYRGDSNAAVKLTALIKRGCRGSAQWHMPPHPEISDADARRIAKYILSLRE